MIANKLLSIFLQIFVSTMNLMSVNEANHMQWKYPELETTISR